MRWIYCAVLVSLTATFGRAQSNPEAWTPGTPPLQKFEGTGAQNTATFHVPDGWKLLFQGFRPLKLTVYTADGKIVMGSATTGTGMFYFQTGGTYYLRVEGFQPQGQAGAATSPPASSGLMGTITDSVNPQSNGNGNSNETPNRPQPPPGYNAFVSKWTISIYDGTVAATQSHGLFDYTPPGNTDGPGGVASSVSAPAAPAIASAAAAPGAVVPAPVGAAAVALKLTEDQTRAIVFIRGDHAEGTGFLVKMPDGPYVVTNLHVIGNNPNIKITTSNGNVIPMLSAKGAADRDLALLQIKDAGYSYLDMSSDMATSVQAGDDVLTPGNSEGGGVVLSTTGKILGIGPDRIEFDNPIYHGNSGGPVFHPKTGKVLGVVTMAIKVEQDNDLDKASFASRNSAITKQMRYFGLRLDTVSSWVPLDWRRFQNETTFLDQFHEQSRSLDSFLNAPKSANGNGSGTDDAARLYLGDKKIMSARDEFVKEAQGADGAQRVQAFRELLYNLTSIVDADLTSAQDPNNFYSFDQERARYEAVYRKALKTEIDSVGDDVSRLNGLSRSGSGNNNNNGSNN